ncbi:MAG: hypothetical protein NW900_01865, partial [Candidatus Blochmannia sp. A2]|nr:hypothetical protein [Candidatus Blochmannia sp. A2]
ANNIHTHYTHTYIETSLDVFNKMKYREEYIHNYTCIYIYMYVCMYVCICMYVCKYVCMCMYVYIHTHILKLSLDVSNKMKNRE